MYAFNVYVCVCIDNRVKRREGVGLLQTFIAHKLISLHCLHFYLKNASANWRKAVTYHMLQLTDILLKSQPCDFSLCLHGTGSHVL